jgi:hypothetical protein
VPDVNDKLEMFVKHGGKTENSLPFVATFFNRLYEYNKELNF